MSDETQQDIRRLLKRFGIEADEAVMAYIESAPGQGPLRVRLTLEDLTDYGDKTPETWLYVEVEGEIRR
jgi:hypothetical protein